MKRYLSMLAMIVLLIALALPVSASAAVSMKLKNGMVDIAVNGKTVAAYHTKGFSKPILFPVIAPAGVPVTRAWPIEGEPMGSKDHVHHRSVWFCHGDVIPEGVKLKHKIRGVDGVDFWSEHVGHGIIACTEVKIGPSGKNWASINTKNEWRTADGQVILTEDRDIIVVETEKGVLFIYNIDLHASECPIVFGDTKEGSMGVRVHDQLREKGGNGVMTNAKEMTTEKNIWGRQAVWCDYSGKVDGKQVGLTIFDDPKNVAPAAWHARSYGLMAANPFGRKRSGFPDTKKSSDLVRLDKGEHLRLRYGVYVHDGDVITGDVADTYKLFVKLRDKK